MFPRRYHVYLSFKPRVVYLVIHHNTKYKPRDGACDFHANADAAFIRKYLVLLGSGINVHIIDHFGHLCGNYFLLAS
jgi:hypothetical protein